MIDKEVFRLINFRLIKLLLYVAKRENADVDATKLQKIFFLLEKEKGVELGLNFEPWFFGPYSELLQDYIDKLIELGEVDVIEHEVKDPFTELVITYNSTYVLKGEFKPEEKDVGIMEFFKEWVRKSRSEILKYVYEKYPEYGKYSLIRDKILGS